MQTNPTATFFTISVISLLVAALVVFVGAFWWRSCKTTPSVVTEGYGFMNTMAKTINPEETQAAAANLTVAIPPFTNAVPAMKEPSPEILKEAEEKMAAAVAAAGVAAPVPSPVPSPVSPEPLTPPATGTTVKAAFTNFGGSVFEGFAGPVRGAGQPDCLRTSSTATALYELLSSRPVTTEEGPDDLREMRVLLGKLACFKRDLTGTAGVVSATRVQPFSTSHDLEPVAETTARCFAKTISQRDLSLSLDKWGSRGTFLLKRLCTALGFTDAQEAEALRLFGDTMADVSDIAMARCCSIGSTAVIAGQSQPRMVGGYEAPSLEGREYNGYY